MTDPVNQTPTTAPPASEATLSAREALARAQAKVSAIVPDERRGNFGLTSVQIKRVDRLRRVRDKARFALAECEAADAAGIAVPEPAPALERAPSPASAPATMFSH